MKRILLSAAVAALTATAIAANNAPAFANGTYIYRVCTTDAPEGCAAELKDGFRLVSNMLDGDIRQVPIVNGIVGHDHNGGWNWDGLWPYWNRPTFRVGGTMEKLRQFMHASHDEANTFVSFHVNLTDVNLGLADYPESLAFFRRLVDTKSIYRRDWNPDLGRRDGDPYTMTEAQLLAERANGNPIDICSLVDYKRFWDSGLAKEMIDSFYAAIPYAPPVLYLDVFNETGGNFSTGYPEGGNFETQQEGATNICAYLRSLGTEVGTEGPRDYFLDKYGTYGWLHCLPGYATRDYSRIWGAPTIYDRISYMHVVGNTGAFAVSPIGATAAQVEKDTLHFNTLVRGEASPRVMPGDKTFHIAFRGGDNDEYNQMHGMAGGDGLRGDWIDLVNNFYLCTIQELYHIGKGNNRTDEFLTLGNNHFNGVVITDPDGNETVLQLADDMDIPSGVDRTRAMLEWFRHWKYTAPKDGTYKVQLEGYYTGRSFGGSQVYVDDTSIFRTDATIFPGENETALSRIECGTVQMTAGEHSVHMDAGELRATWDDGTVSVWSEPALNRGFTCRNGDVYFAYDYDRMWPDTWSGKRKIYFFSWNGTSRTWKLPSDWAAMPKVSLYPLTPQGRGTRQVLDVVDGSVSPVLLKQVPYILVPYEEEQDEGLSAEAVAALPILTAQTMATLDAQARTQEARGTVDDPEGTGGGSGEGGDSGEGGEGGEQGGEGGEETPLGDRYVRFLGCETSTGSRYSGDVSQWGASGDSGIKAAWRSTSTAAKAFVIPGNANAYGVDGYFCGTTLQDVESEDSRWKGSLYTGTRTGDAIAGITSYASVEMLNMNTVIGNDPSAATCDDPRGGIVAAAASLVSSADIFWSFGSEPTEQGRVNAMRITFNENIADHPLVRIGFSCDRGDKQNPAEIIVVDQNGVDHVGTVSGQCQYGYYNWVFFEVKGAQSGDALTVCLKNMVRDETRWSDHGAIGIIAFDSTYTGSNLPPVVESVSASSASVEIHNWSASVTLSATASDPDGDDISYSWLALGDQPGGYVFASPNSATTAVELSAAGTYKFYVQVTDAFAQSAASEPVTVTVTVPADEAHVEYVGIEVSSLKSGAWGTVSEGFKSAFRSLSEGIESLGGKKAFLLAGKPNAYGLDGYIFPDDPVKGNFVTSGVLYDHTVRSGRDEAIGGEVATVVSNAAPYLVEFEFSNLALLGAGCYQLDDPREEISESVADFTPGFWQVAYGSHDYETAARLRFGKDVRRCERVRVGIISGRGDSQKPSHVRVGGVSAAWEGTRAGDHYGEPCIMFFDIFGAKAGTVVDIETRNVDSSYSFIEGIIFDSVEARRKALMIVVR